jgi:hypothetical protein
MPDGFWALLSIIVAFYFGGRMQLKRQDMAIKDGALAVAREVLAVQQAKREHDEATRAPTIPDAEGQPGPTRSLSSGLTRGNRVIESWKRRRLLEAG